jgi:hypothetical protein
MFVPCGSFLPPWIGIANPGLDVDPGTPVNPDLIRIQTRIRIYSTAKCYLIGLFYGSPPFSWFFFGFYWDSTARLQLY